MLKLEAGKRYLRRDGTLSGALSVYENGGCYVWWDGEFFYTSGGRILRNQEKPADIVAEAVTPEPERESLQPLEWKRGIPTEEECRECWLIDGLSGPGPCCHSTGDVYQPGGSSPDDWDGYEWYIALRIKPVEPPKPKTKTITLQQFTHTSGDKCWIVCEGGEMAGCWTATGKTKTVEVPCE